MDDAGVDATRLDRAGSGSARYDFELDLDSDSTHATVVRLAGAARRVLELGPATGYMTAALNRGGAAVTGIEIDASMARQAEPHLERLIVGDLDSLDLATELADDRFDVIIAADVLEHLKDPLGVLRQLREHLTPDGFFVISLPNIAHGSVRLALLEGRFEYQKLGLLDETHLRFFTRHGIERLMDEAELGIAELHRQELNLDASEISFDADRVSAETLAALDQDPDARTYQFVLKAVPFAAPGMRAIQARMRDQATMLSGLRLELVGARVREEQLEAALAAISSREGQLRASLIAAHEQLLERDAEIQRLSHRPLQSDLIAQARQARRITGAVKRRLKRAWVALERA